MTIDERLEFLVTSTESLHATCQQLHAIVAEQTRRIEAQAAKEDRLRQALLEGIRTFLEGMNGEAPEGDTE